MIVPQNIIVSQPLALKGDNFPLPFHLLSWKLIKTTSVWVVMSFLANGREDKSCLETMRPFPAQAQANASLSFSKTCEHWLGIGWSGMVLHGLNEKLSFPWPLASFHEESIPNSCDSSR